MTTPPTPAEIQLAAKLDQAFGTADLYSRATSRISLEALWHSPDVAAAQSQRIANFLDRRSWLSDAEAVVVSDKVKVPFSILPLVCAVVLSHKKRLLIWKEHAELLHGTSQVYGDITLLGASSAPILICHDVFVYGYALVKIVCDLRRTLDDPQLGARLRIASLINLGGAAGTLNLSRLIHAQTGIRLDENQFDFLVDVSDEWSALQEESQ